MTKKRNLNSSEVKRARMAARNGYATYRYGSTKPVTLPRVFKGEAKEAKVSAVMEILKDWRLSPFEHEGEVRAGIRSGLCLAGYKGKSIGWSEADFEAECLVGEALKLMGAKRPTLLEGQRQYAVEREYCQWCHGKLDEDDRAGHRQFCSNECGAHARNHNLPLFQRITNIRQSMAHYVAAKELQPEQECQWCQKTFKPASLLHKIKTVTCSTECNRAYVGSLKGAKKCLHCKETFIPRWVTNTKYCCVECERTHRKVRLRAESAERRVPTPCEQCGEQFVPKKAGTRFCGHRCQLKSQQERAKERNERPCIECGVLFRPARPSAQSCSAACAGAVRARKTAEEKSASAFICEDVTGFREAAE
ncbi:MAG: hypothetical protein KUA43_18015 [Hoeflea sp.]|uniref:hypothetical protein n=1 Tax=Hoeflea sp. TaxID=1940281 RepID=UPI001D615DC3|nr:hypothetical protein [Hoeflea sp.]MBU4529172.1 hypothetical protein [Alphaproteobacteria bacterium]MBU4543577.1 hypothetical protein [Alphaproteobacteria bacterium]MBU4549202.1 hypothetical protein [Alphaproteobacteria bacterium]MBV1725337.1 hypothetical protein [Hoeflea sp.]MBV1785298.1 hypothetical protein [Hoeflea sp.]